MMTEQERTIVEREIAEAKRKGYQMALLDLQNYANEQIASADSRFAGTGRDFIQGIKEGLSMARSWGFYHSDF